MENENNELEGWKYLLEAGFPAWQIADQLEKHLKALEALPADTEGRAGAIERATAYLADVRQLAEKEAST